MPLLIQYSHICTKCATVFKCEHTAMYSAREVHIPPSRDGLFDDRWYCFDCLATIRRGIGAAFKGEI